ncbi:MAG: hypothetical protein KF866_05455 [Phycisphaeraceae bacterium]|nr:hypothetical protein [Phycisphaeraceae bacterium]MCW5754439.1 hypothetical protein [Phycisphaeraceae bacterium]
MPTYDYRCQACAHEFELFQSMKDAPKRKCPSCGRAALERLIGTGAAVLFKGSGFYETDYRSESYKKAAEAEAKTGANTGDDSKNGTASAADAKSPGSATPAAAGAESPPEMKKGKVSASTRVATARVKGSSKQAKTAKTTPRQKAPVKSRSASAKARPSRK